MIIHNQKASDTLLDNNPVLRRALMDRVVVHPEGREITLKANISLENARALYGLVRARKPNVVVEIGMAYAVSTLTILTGLRDNDCGKLISIDPYENWPTGRLVALNQVAEAGLSSRHEHLYEPDFIALPSLLKDGVSPDLVYIDGLHDFPYVMLDMFYADKLLPVGGIVGFNDAGWQSVYRVIRRIKEFGAYQELDVALPRMFRSRNFLFSLIKRIEGRSSLDRYFQKR